MKPDRIMLDLDTRKAEIVATALAHIWREVFDKSTAGDGAVLRECLDQLNQITMSRR